MSRAVRCSRYVFRSPTEFAGYPGHPNRAEKSSNRAVSGNHLFTEHTPITGKPVESRNFKYALKLKSLFEICANKASANFCGYIESPFSTRLEGFECLFFIAFLRFFLRFSDMG
jgi:hypothetical protein